MFELEPGKSGGHIRCTVCGQGYGEIARITVAGWDGIREMHAHDLDCTCGRDTAHLESCALSQAAFARLTS